MQKLFGSDISNPQDSLEIDVNKPCQATSMMIRSHNHQDAVLDSTNSNVEELIRDFFNPAY
mgnify:CR=1 FL=1